MKNFMDRMMPLIEPAIELRNGHCAHPIRQSGPPAKLVLVSNCGFWEADNFDPLLAQFERAIADGIVRKEHRILYSVADDSEKVFAVLEDATVLNRPPGKWY